MIRNIALAVLLGAAWPLQAQDEPAAPATELTLQEEALERQKEVTSIRNLKFKRDVTVGVYSKTELLDFITREFNKELPPEKAQRYQRGYVKLGLIPPGLDLHQAIIDLFSSSIAGFYHPQTKELRLVCEVDQEVDAAAKVLGIDIDSMTLVHELTHAAQDQNFELSTIPLDDETNDDLILALKAALEGDASVVGWTYALKDNFSKTIGSINLGFKAGMLPGKAGALPAFLRFSLTFPYGHGTEFVMAGMKKNGGAIAKNSALLEDWPLSSEQILHPKKYFEKRDNPTLIALPDLGALFGAPWKESFNNVMGEFAIGILLREFCGKQPGPPFPALKFKDYDEPGDEPDGDRPSKPESSKLRLSDVLMATQGWDGDRYVFLENGDGGILYVWASTWDSEEDAKEFAGAYVLALRKKYALADPVPAGDRIAFETKEGRVLVERRGTDVLVMDGVTEAMIGRADAIWKDLKKSEMTAFERRRYFVCDKCGVKEAFSGPCSKCQAPLQFRDPKDDGQEPLPPKKKRNVY